MQIIKNLNTNNFNTYANLLKVISSISRLFSDNKVPFLYYRVVENLFCQTFNAENLSRTDTAFDSKIKALGIGIKTFIQKSESSFEKIAEFNKLSHNFRDKSIEEVVLLLSSYRNDRINVAKNTYDIQDTIYHCVTRRESELILYDCEYKEINIDKIKKIKQSTSGIQFEDDSNEYSFNFSKSTLYKKFYLPNDYDKITVDILDNPFDLIDTKFILNEETMPYKVLNKNDNQKVILPLYSTKKSNSYKKIVAEKSGLNQWNASGRPRDNGEIYIPIPKHVHDKFPNFFPPRYQSFQLELPNGKFLSASVCQENSKALMTNPNNAMSDWLLRKVLGLKEKELLTYEKLQIAGFDSVIIEKINNNHFKIDIYNDIEL